MKDSHRTTATWELPHSFVDSLRQSAGSETDGLGDEVGALQIKTFVYSVVRPTEVRHRVTERYEPGLRTLTQHVTISAQLPTNFISRGQESNGRRSVYFPVLIPPKGELANDLQVFAPDGSLVPVLSHQQYLRLVARSLRTLLCIAYEVDKMSESDYSHALQAERLALQGIVHQTRSPADNSGIGALRELARDPEIRDRHALYLAVELATILLGNYAIIAATECTDDGMFVISYRRVTTPYLELEPSAKAGGLAKLKFRLRLLLGARPVDIGIDLHDATTCQSYHLIVDGVDGVYVGEQWSPDIVKYCNAHYRHNRDSRQRGKRVDPPPYFRFMRRAGQRHAHFYTRFFPSPIPGLHDGDKVPVARFRFYEVPPGSVARASVAAAASTILVWLIGLVISRNPDPGTDAPAFLLAFPAIAAGWLGFESRSHRLLEGTLAARLSLLVTALVSISATALFMFFKSGLSYFSGTFPMSLHVLGIDSWAWGLLTLLGFLNTLCIGYAYMRRSLEFIHLSTRRGDRNKEYA